MPLFHRNSSGRRWRRSEPQESSSQSGNQANRGGLATESHAVFATDRCPDGLLRGSLPERNLVVRFRMPARARPGSRQEPKRCQRVGFFVCGGWAATRAALAMSLEEVSFRRQHGRNSKFDKWGRRSEFVGREGPKCGSPFVRPSNTLVVHTTLSQVASRSLGRQNSRRDVTASQGDTWTLQAAGTPCRCGTV
jgi:hypothetical protein